MRRIVAVVVISLGSLALLPSAAGAGGADWFEFKRPYYAPGEAAVGRTRVWFASEGRARMATRGRFVAYLLPRDRWLRPPGVPAAAISLGPVIFSSPDGTTAVATLDFTVPEVPDGDWTIGVCNVPCTKAAIGGLYGGSIRIASSPAMAATLHLEDRLHLTRQMARHDSRRMERQLRVVRVQLDELRTEVGLLEQQLERRERSVANERPSATGFPVLLGWLLVGLTVAFGLVAFRPRRRPVLAPDPPAIERIDEPEREPVP